MKFQTSTSFALASALSIAGTVTALAVPTFTTSVAPSSTSAASASSCTSTKVIRFEIGQQCNTVWGGSDGGPTTGCTPRLTAIDNCNEKPAAPSEPDSDFNVTPVSFAGTDDNVRPFCATFLPTQQSNLTTELFLFGRNWDYTLRDCVDGVAITVEQKMSGDPATTGAGTSINFPMDTTTVIQSTAYVPNQGQYHGAFAQAASALVQVPGTF